MESLHVFLLAFVFSFLGSIPPGTLNITILQLGLSHKLQIAWRFAFAAAVVEYPYAWIAVIFERAITTSPAVIENFKLITALVMVALGVFNLWAVRRSTSFSQKFEASGFRRGILLGILNPLAIPFWIAVTAYMRAQGWINLTRPINLHSYLAGVSIGAFVLLMLLAFMAKRLVRYFQPTSWGKKVPGFVLLALGVYAFIQYLL